MISMFCIKVLRIRNESEHQINEFNSLRFTRHTIEAYQKNLARYPCLTKDSNIILYSIITYIQLFGTESIAYNNKNND